eukprot:SAG11_NODE_955_length_6395_cov_7.590534_1_plen_282_part_00
MKRDIDYYIQGCESCQQYKISRLAAKTKLEIMQTPKQIGESYNIDFMTDMPPSGVQKYDFCAVIVDRLSKRKFLILCHKTNSAAEIADLFYDEICCEQGRGIPKEIISDRDPRFMSKFWKQFQYRSGTSLRFSTARQQSTNGLAERAISVIDEVLSIYVNYKQDNWAALMPQIVYSINGTPDMTASHRRSPLFIEYGFNPRKPIGFLDSSPEARETDEDIDERILRLTALREQIYESVREAQIKMKKMHENDSNRRCAHCCMGLRFRLYYITYAISAPFVY